VTKRLRQRIAAALDDALARGHLEDASLASRVARAVDPIGWSRLVPLARDEIARRHAQSAAGMTRGVFSIAKTKRGRFVWCVWWSDEPSADPFRAPDAWAGGAESEEEARKAAEKAADVPLTEIEGRWARAWLRVKSGEPAFPKRPPRRIDPARPREQTPYEVLGLAPGASTAQVKAAFRARAIEHHPDQGGDAERFMRVKRAYDAIMRRRENPTRSRR
jgi:hypothetical protein